MNDDYKYRDITRSIIGAAMEVHKTLGNGFQELIYQRALEIEFVKRSLNFQRELSMPVYYGGYEIGNRRVDFLVQDLVIVELKALIKLEDVHLAQAKNYLEAFNLEVGLLLNFGSNSLQFKRLIHTPKNPEIH